MSEFQRILERHLKKVARVNREYMELMKELNSVEQAETFARKALVSDLRQEASDATIRAVAIKMAKAFGNVRNTRSKS